MDVIMTSPRLATQAVALLEGAGARIHYMDPFPTPEAIAALARSVGAVAILSRQGPVTAAVIEAVPSLRVVARHGVGVDDVDVPEALRRGIVVTRAPGSNTRAVAEHTIAMILALAKRLPELSAQVAAGEWRHGNDMVRDVAGLRLGLIGLGSIGQMVAGFGTAFGMDVAAYTRSPGPAGITRMPDLAALLARSDVLSLHLPYSPAAHHLIGRTELATLPAGATVINTARGGLIDEAALLEALDSGHLSGAGLDVFEGEPPELGNALRRHPAVIATPHVSGVTEGSLVTMGVMAAECIVAVLTGRPVPPERLVLA